jgi:hypothetical protein
MRFVSTSVKRTVKDIEAGRIFLPPIQRSFVWRHDRIVNLFDSLYRNYPIGNCIFWRLSPGTSRNYPLYRFVREYTEKKGKSIKNEPAPENLLHDDVYSVVDGQQRLSSMYIALAGTYRYKKSGRGLQDLESNFIPTYLHMNLFAKAGGDEGETLFDFLSKEEAAYINTDNLWVDVGGILKWRSKDEAVRFIKEIGQRVNSSGKKTAVDRFKDRKERTLETLQCLFDMLNDDRVYFFDIDSQNLDEVVDIFTRVNSGGMTLKKSDLLFSILISQWTEGRDEINQLVESLQESGIGVSQDFVMRACLVLSDLPIKYNLESFKRKNIASIKKNWEDIKRSLLALTEILPEIGYKDLPNLSDNALIPIAYYISKGGKTGSIKAKRALQRYYVVSQVKGIYGGQSDQTLERIRGELKRSIDKEKGATFPDLSESRLPGGKSFKITIEELGELVEETGYGSPHAYFLLSLIYPTVDFKIKRYEVDHIHPRSKFNRKNLRNLGVEDESVIEDWMEEKCELLPNLQLLGGKENNNKKSKTLNEFIQSKTPAERRQFIKENLLPTDKHLRELLNFEGFFEFRKRKLVNGLKRHFGL